MSAKHRLASRRDTPAPTGVLARRRAVSSVSRDKYEQQADDAAARILRGEKGIARLLTPAPAASYRVGTSTGRPLPVNLREHLEEAFGASLGSVRIHTDGASDAVARMERATAFTSGADIYFGAGAFRPHTVVGERLLIHEVAHVLQQTGRPSFARTLRATPAAGAGPIQRQGLPGFDDLRALHKPSNAPAKSAYGDVANQLGEVFKKPDPAAAVASFAKEKRLTVKDWPEQAESLLYDTLKVLGQFEEAVALLERSNFAGGMRIQTAFSSPKVRALLETRNGPGVYGKAIEKHPVLVAYWEEYLRLVEVFILQPLDKAVPPLFRQGASEKIADHLAGLVKNLQDVTDLSDNEWMFGGLVMMAQLDLVRLAIMENLRKQAANRDFDTPLFEKRFRAEGVRDVGARLKEFEFLTPEGNKDESEQQKWESTYQRLGDRLEEIGNRVMDQWDHAEALQAARVAYFKNLKVQGDAQGDEDVDPIKEAQSIVAVAKRFGLDKLFLGFIKKWKAPGKSGASVPDADEYAARASKLAGEIDKFSRDNVESKQPALLHQRKTDDEIAVIWLTIWMSYFSAALREIAGTTKAGKPAAETLDARVADRIRKARALRRFADALSWPQVVTECEAVLVARAEKQSQLALLADWSLQGVPTEELKNDFDRPQPLEGYGPFSAYDLVLFYHSRYYETLNNRLIAQLPKNSAEERQWVEATTAKTPYLLNQAITQVKTTLSRPVRYGVDPDQFELALKEGDARFDEVLMRHPKTRALVDAKNKEGYQQVFPTEFHGRVFVWFLPALDELVTQIRKIDAVKVAVAAVIPDQDKLSNDGWLNAITTYLTPLLRDPSATLPAEAQNILAAVRGELSARRKKAWDTLLPKIRAATRVDRQVLAQQGRTALQLYADDHLKYYSAPTDLVAAIQGFSAGIAPEEDRPLQVAALVLELTPKLDAAFSSERRYDVINGLLGWFELAQKVAQTRQPDLLRIDPEAILPDRERQSDWIAKRLEELKPIIERFRLVRAEVQTRFGFKADSANGQLLSMVYAEEIKPGMEMSSYDGTRFKLLEVKRSFTFHPAYGQEPLGPESTPTGYSPPQLHDQDDEKDLEAAPDDVLLVCEVNGVKTDIHANKVDPNLTKIADAVERKAFSLGMEHLAWLIDKYAELLMDAAELVPGYGQVVTGVRVLQAVAEFYAEGGYEGVKALIKDGIEQYLERLWHEIKQWVDPEHLWMLLLFGDERLDAILGKLTAMGAPSGATGKPGKPGRSGGSAKGRFGGVKRVIEGFRKLGKALFNAWVTLHERIQEPMDDFRTYCSTRPLLAFVFSFIADHIVEILQIAEKVLAMAFDENSTSLSLDFKSMVSAQQKKLVERVHGLLQRLEVFQLPGTVIHMEPIYQFVLDELILFVMGRLGSKGKAIRLILKETGALDLFTSKIASELVQQGVDPNVYWRDKIVPLIRDQFNEARDTLVAEIHERLQALNFGGGMFDPIAKAPQLTTIPVTTEEFSETKYEGPPPETETQPMAGRTPTSPAKVPPITGGAPLDPATRAAAERRFGHDFGHVRLHTLADAEAMTSRFQADALTTGSHIFVRPGISPGQRLLDHELTHVLQQTGPRPVGASHSAQPVTGAPGRGLNRDAIREAAADRVAELVGGRTGGGAVPIEAGSAEGLQPVLNMNPFTIAKFLRTVSSTEAIKKRQTDIERIISTGWKKPKLGEVESGVRATLDALGDVKNLKEGSSVFKNMLGSVFTQLDNNSAAIEKAAYQIASDAHESKPAAKGGGQGKEKKIDIFKPGHFARELEGYILGRTGMVLSFDFALEKKEIEGEKTELITGVNAIKVLHVHLPYVDGHSDLWIKVMDNTWHGADANQRAKLREAAREYLTDKISATVFNLFGSTYQFSTITTKKVQDLVRTAGGGALPASALPPWQEYVETDPAKGKTYPPHGHIGLRLATYAHGSQTSTGRESHHLTQYLLADYFSNNNDTKAFKDRRTWPGVKSGAGGVDRFEAPGRDPIQIGRTRGGDRGGLMPSISLAASTHRGGSLHITPAPDDIGGKAQKTQGYAVNNEFNRNLPEALRGDAEKKDHDAYLKKTPEDDVKDTIYVAIQQTYQTVRKHMADRLKAALPEFEMAYYKALAEDNPARALSSKDESDFDAALRAVPGKAEEHNKTGLEALGWKTSI